MSLLAAVEDNNPTLLSKRIRTFFSSAKYRSIDCEKDENGCTALNLCAIYGYNQCCSVLLQHGANKEHADENGCTPLLNAAKFGNDKCLELLYKSGANLECQDKRGNNALLLAAKHAQDGVIPILLKYGLCTDHVNCNGVTALQIIQKSLKSCTDPTMSAKLTLCEELLVEYDRIMNSIQLRSSGRSATCFSLSATSPRRVTRKKSAYKMKRRSKKIPEVTNCEHDDDSTVLCEEELCRTPRLAPTDVQHTVGHQPTDRCNKITKKVIRCDNSRTYHQHIERNSKRRLNYIEPRCRDRLNSCPIVARMSTKRDMIIITMN